MNKNQLETKQEKNHEKFPDSTEPVPESSAALLALVDSQNFE